MTVREMMQFLSQFSADDEVVACDWEDTSALRVFPADGSRRGELRWAHTEEEEEDE